ncbi:lamin tail domain-containing protein [archaeon]|jgi:hypothetical protein|nr:lamin tail domain-containing protein [archaeon]
MIKKILIFIEIILLIPLVFSININEVELNPFSSDAGKEWIEIYSPVKVNLSGWSLTNNDDQTIFLNYFFQDYLTINFTTQWLDNSDEKVILKNNQGKIISETPIFIDSKNNNKTWQLCGKNWKFDYSTKGLINFLDKDKDCVLDSEDKCSNTKIGEVVDNDGCSNTQFCAKQNRCGKGCNQADWKNNEIEIKYPNDCRTVIRSKGKKFYPYCAGLICAD